MSGKFISTGKKTNSIQNPHEIEILNNLKIEGLTIHIVPLSPSKALSVVRVIGKFFQNFIHPIFTPTIAHVAIELNLENS